jgi:type VI secretion system secreted protein Hcp
MALDTYMTLNGHSQGMIDGDVTSAGYVGWIIVNDLRWLIDGPRDAASGLPTGHKASQPLAVSVPTGRHTPKVLQALMNNETLTAQVDVRHALANGTVGIAYQLNLTDANVASFETNLVDGTSSPFDNYLFTFQTIELTWHTSTSTISQNVVPAGWSMATS